MNKLETKRLFLRPFRMEDLQDFYEYCKLETVGPNAGWLPHKDIGESKKLLKIFSESEEVLAIYHKNDKKVIGSIGVHNRVRNDVLHYELGYVLSTYYEGRGLMTEAVNKVLEYCFKIRGIKEIFVMHEVTNTKSERVIIKTGFQYTNNLKIVTDNFGIREMKCYILTNKEYFKKRREL